MKKIIISVFLLAALLVPNSYGQEETGDDSAYQLARFMPPGALAFAEVDDLNARLGFVLDAAWKDHFLKSKAFKDFAVSKLYNKIGDRMRALEETTGFSLSLENIRALAGGRSALALYDIGELRFLFLSELPMERVAASALWNLRDRFEQRGEGADRYWVKEDPYGRVTLAFAVVSGRLLVGTDVLRFEQALDLLREGGDSLADDGRFNTALPSASTDGQVFVYLDQERIVETPYWRSYWLFGNQEQLADIHSAVLLLDLNDNEIRETRWLRRDRLPDSVDSFVDIDAALPAGAAYYEYGVADDAGLQEQLRDLFGCTGEENIESLAAPFQKGVMHTYGLVADIVGSADGQGIRFHKVIAIDLGDPAAFDAVKFEKAVADMFSARLLSRGRATLRFVDRDGMRVLDLPLFEEEAPAYRVDGGIVLFANTAEALSSPGGADEKQREFLAAQSGVAAAMWLQADHATGKLSEFFALLGDKNGWRPQSNAAYFSENLTSLLSIFEGIKAVSLVRTIENGEVRETVSYRLGR